jgi:hypothetical protein
MQQNRHECYALRTYPNLFSLYTNFRCQMLIYLGGFSTEGSFTFEMTWFESQETGIVAFLSFFTHVP